MKKVILAIVRIAVAIVLGLLPLTLSIIHIYKPISYELHKKFFSCMYEYYSAFTYFGGIYYAALNLLLFGKKMSFAFFIGICGLALYHIAEWITYFSYAMIDDLGCGILGLVASYHFLSFLLCFGVVRFLQSIIRQIKISKSGGENYDSIEKDVTTYKNRLWKYLPSIYMLIWAVVESAWGELNITGVWIAILNFILAYGYILPIVHPIYLVVLSYREKKKLYLFPLLEMGILLIPYLLIPFLPISIEKHIICIVILYEYFLTCFLWSGVFLLRGRRKQQINICGRQKNIEEHG